MRVPSAPERPALSRLMGAYLNEDWPDDYGEAWTAVDDFIAGETLVGQLPQEIREALGRHDSETAVETLLLAYGCAYSPEPDGVTYRAWLEAIAARVEQSPRAAPVRPAAPKR